MRLWRTGIVDPHTTLWRGCTASAASIGWPQSWGPPGRSKARCPTRKHWRARPPSMRMRRGRGERITTLARGRTPLEARTLFWIHSHQGTHTAQTISVAHRESTQALCCRVARVDVRGVQDMDRWIVMGLVNAPSIDFFPVLRIGNTSCCPSG